MSGRSEGKSKLNDRKPPTCTTAPKVVQLTCIIIQQHAGLHTKTVQGWEGTGKVALVAGSHNLQGS